MTNDTLSSQILQRLNQIADAAVLAALFTILAFQEIRFEGYEAEKASLLIILLGILAATLFCRLIIYPAALRQIAWRSPVILGVCLLAIITLFSTFTALSPSVSLLGSADRSQGAVMQWGYILLFIQSVLSAERLQKYLFPVLMVMAVPLCLFAWIMQFGFAVPRPGSTTGNPNFLASWLILAILVIGWEFTSSLNLFSNHGSTPLSPPNHGSTPLSPPIHGGKFGAGSGGKKILFVYTLFVLLLMLATLALTASRGALLGLIVAVFIFFGLWAAVHGKRRLLLMVTLVSAGGIGVYVAVGQSLGLSRPAEEVPRFFRFFEDFRVESWTGAHYLLFEYHQPMIDATGTPDTFAAVRPFMGYGLDNVAYMQGIVDTVYQRVTYLNSFHNFLIDTLVMHGGIGIVAWMLIYGGAAYLALRHLKLLPDKWRGLCLLVFILAVPFTIWMVGNILWYVNVRFLVFLGAGLGLVVGLWAWLLIITWLHGAKSQFPRFQGEDDNDVPLPVVRGGVGDGDASSMHGSTPLNPPIHRGMVKAGVGLLSDQSFIMILLCVMVARWVDVQFGFVQIATEPLWWVLLGFLVAFTQRETASPVLYGVEKESGSENWLISILLSGLFLLHGLGNAITSRFIGYSLGMEYLLPLLIATLVAGGMGAYAAQSRSLRKLLPGIGVVIAIWALSYAFKEGLVASASSMLDNLVIQPEVPPESLFAPFQLLALRGILLVWGSGLVWFWVLGQFSEARKHRKRRNTAHLPVWIFGVVFIGGVFGSVYSVTEFSAATLHAGGRGFAAVDGTKTYSVGLAAFAAAGYSQPNRGQLYVEEAELAMKYVHFTGAATTPDTAAEPALIALFAIQPYYHYTRPWALFCENYPISRCAQLRDYLPKNE